MTDLITRARKEWCEPHQATTTMPATTFSWWQSCPPEVVEALLEVLCYAETRWFCPHCGGKVPARHQGYCRIGRAEAVITRALEGK
jgi:hypothetical protein